MKMKNDIFNQQCSGVQVIDPALLKYLSLARDFHRHTHRQSLLGNLEVVISLTKDSPSALAGLACLVITNHLISSNHNDG